MTGVKATRINVTLGQNIVDYMMEICQKTDSSISNYIQHTIWKEIMTRREPTEAEIKLADQATKVSGLMGDFEAGIEFYDRALSRLSKRDGKPMPTFPKKKPQAGIAKTVHRDKFDNSVDNAVSNVLSAELSTEPSTEVSTEPSTEVNQFTEENEHKTKKKGVYMDVPITPSADNMI